MNGAVCAGGRSDKFEGDEARADVEPYGSSTTSG